MNLLLEIGNSYSKYATAKGEVLSNITSVDSQKITDAWLQQHFPAVKKCIISNVSNVELNHIIEQWCQKQKIHFLLIKSEAEKFNVKCAYEKPSSFGVDRWLGLQGAAKLYPKKNCLIIDSGTATTVDLLSEYGQHLGGWILPGIDLMLSSVINNTKNVNAEAELIDHLSFANNTSGAVNQAVWSATLGLIEQAITHSTKLCINTNQPLIVILTGGNARRLNQLAQNKYTLIEHLLFVGINRYVDNLND